MGHLGQRQRQRRPGRSPELLRHLLSGRIGQELRRPPQRQAREACRPAAHHLRSGRACEDRRRDAAAAAGRQLLRLLLLPAHEHDHEGQRLRSRSAHLRLLRADRGSRYPVSKKRGAEAFRPSEAVKKYNFLTKGFAVCCAHNLCAAGAQIPHLQPEKYFLRRTCRRRK